MSWKQNIQTWRALPPEERQRRMLVQSPLQVWQSMAFEREPVSLKRLQARHRLLMQQSRDSSPPPER